jgi:hypothetical protein
VSGDGGATLAGAAWTAACVWMFFLPRPRQSGRRRELYISPLLRLRSPKQIEKPRVG